GSGSTGVASILLNRNFTGYELEADFFAIANERLKHAASEQQQIALFGNADAD
ncbi:MAG: site-specific DNA-methyltransferase, partial [Rhizobacter sp.]|nr:site-specific DNA-methyltransferase [Chlorobiales bacterium]